MRSLAFAVRSIGGACSLLLALLLVTIVSPGAQAFAQNSAADSGDFTQDGLKFHRTTPAGTPNMPSVFMITEISSSNSVGECMVRPDGSTTFVPFGGYDQSKLESAYKNHVHAAPDAGGANTAATTAPAAANSFDAASDTVSLTDGRLVRFIDDTHAEVKLPGPAGVRTYELEYHKGGAGGFMRSYSDAARGRQGESFSGSGVKISIASANGMPGGEFYDTARGVNTEGPIAKIQPIVTAVHDASDFVKTTNQAQLAQATVIRSLLANNLGLK